MAIGAYLSSRSARRALGAVILLASCSGCVSSEHLAQQQAPAPIFDPATFFVGSTQGEAVLKIALHRPERVEVQGRGRIDADSTLVLDQSVRSGKGPTTQRTWRFHRDGPGRWSGTLSDAAGPVAGYIDGNCLHLSFAMKGGLKAQQWLYLQAGSHIARNVMVVRKFGMRVARLDETITRLPAPVPSLPLPPT